MEEIWEIFCQGHSHKLSECARRRIVRETNKTPVNLKELQAAAGKMTETEQQQLSMLPFIAQIPGGWQKPLGGKTKYLLKKQGSRQNII